MYDSEYRDWDESELQKKLPVVLTATEAMEILRVGKNTIYRLLNSGALKGIRIGRSWKVELESLNSFLK